MKILFFVILSIISKDYYKIIGVPRNITDKRLKKAYKKKLLEFHPDKYNDQKQKEYAQKQYTQIQEAYEVLSDRELRQAYDHGGIHMLEEIKKRRNEQENFQRQREANQEKFQGPNSQQERDILEQSHINSLGPKEMSKFGRRLTSWLILFYRNDDDYLKILTPAVEKLMNDFKGIIEVGKINCNRHEEFCRDFMVYGTPKLEIYPSFSGMDAKEFNFMDYLDYLEQGKTKKFLSVLSQQLIASVEDFVQFLNYDNITRFQSSQKEKVVLVTKKNKTPLLWKVLSKEFKSYLDFGIIKPSSGQLLDTLKINQFPTILGFTKNIKTAQEYKKEMTPFKIRQFLRTVINKEHKEYNFEIIGINDYQQTDCNQSDKKICIIMVENPNVSSPEFEEMAFDLQKEFGNDPIKLLYLKQNIINEEFFTLNQLDFDEDNSLLIYKGKYQKAKVIDIDFNQDLFNSVGEVIRNVLSSIIQLDKIQYSMSNYSNQYEELQLIYLIYLNNDFFVYLSQIQKLQTIMAQNEIGNQNNFGLMNDQLELEDNLFDQNNNFGPLELNILERVENGLDDTENDFTDNNSEEFKSDNEKYDGKKEIIFVQGWIFMEFCIQIFYWNFDSIFFDFQ